MIATTSTRTVVRNDAASAHNSELLSPNDCVLPLKRRKAEARADIGRAIEKLEGVMLKTRNKELRDKLHADWKYLKELLSSI